MWRGEFENRFRGWNGEKRRINNKDSMERGVSNFAEREFTFFFFFVFQSGWKRRVPKYCKVLFNNVVSCEVVSFVFSFFLHGYILSTLWFIISIIRFHAS